MRAVPSKFCGQAAVSMATHRGPSRVRSFHAANVDPLASADAAGSFLLISLSAEMDLDCAGGLPERCCSGNGAGAMRPSGTGSHPQWPCICRESWIGHGGAALCFAPPRASSPQPYSPTNFPDLRSPREANFSGFPVLHCVAAPSLRYGMRRARTLTHRITPRPRWARPG
jgi:hypothetical protein